MRKTIRRITAILLAFLLTVYAVPVSVSADTAELGPLRLTRSTSKNLYLGKKDVMTYREILGDLYTDTLDIKAYNMDTSYQDVSGSNVQADWNTKTVSNLFTMPFDRALHWSVYDTRDGTWPYELSVYRNAYYSVTASGTKTLAQILDTAGVTSSDYDEYGLYPDDETEGLIEVNNNTHTLTFLTSELPPSGIQFRLVSPGSGETAAFKLILTGTQSPDNANDGIFTYSLNQNAGTATITGFVNDLDDSEKADITIPSTVTWPKNNGTEYRITGTAGNAFKNETGIRKVTIENPVFTIGESAFQGCSGLTDVRQTQGGTGSKLTIGAYAFCAEDDRNSSLKSFSSEAGISSIGNKAFAFADKLASLTAGDNQKTTIGQNAFQNCAGELTFKGGIADLGSYSFYNTKVSRITTTAIENAWYSIGGWPETPQIDLVLNVSRINNGTLTDAVLTGELLKYASGFRNITVNLQQGVTAVSADAFSSFSFEDYESLTMNIDTKDKDAAITVAEGAVPSNQDKLQVNFRVPRANVTGADTDPLPALEAIGRVTYLDSQPQDPHYHDDVFRYEVEDGKAYITGLYDETATDLLFTSANQGDVYDADDYLQTGMTLNVAGIRAFSDEDKEKITAIVFRNSKKFTVGEDTLNDMPVLESLTTGGGSIELPENAFAGSSGLESVVIGATDNQNASMTIPAGTFDGCSAMTSFICRLNAVTIADGAFAGCSALETAAFTGRGAQQIKGGAFADATGITYLRIDNTYDVEAGAFSITNGAAFVQNNEGFLDGKLADRIGTFENYVFTGKSPYVITEEVFQGKTASTIYLEYKGSSVPEDLTAAVQKAGSNLKDVYIDCAREDVSFADELDAANPKVTVHYRENHIPTGIFLDGVNGNDEGDGSRDHPVKTFAKAKDIIDSMPGGTTETEDETIKTIVTDACSAVGPDMTPGTFTDIYESSGQVMVLNTVTVSGDGETWNSGEGDPIVLLRDPSFTGTLVNVTGRLTLQNIVLDGNRKKVTAQASLINVQEGATLTLDSGSVLRNNAYPVAYWSGREWENGGAVFAKNATVNILNGSTISNNLAMWGGGIQMYGGTLNMSGGSIRNNTAKARRTENNLPVQGNGGGVLLTHGAVMNLSGGSVTNNHASGYEYNSTIGINGSTGGGIQVGGSYNDLNSNSQLNMTGGTVSNNSAYAEGGGICIQDSCTATITKGRITGNESEHDSGSSFGGGGIYVNAARSGQRNGLLKLTDVLITDNDATYGGGIACCETVNMSLYMGNGAAIFGNKDTDLGQHNDLYLFQRNSSFGYGTKAKISPYMMNGAEYNWTHVVSAADSDSPYTNGEKASADLLAYLDAGKSGTIRLKSNPSNTSVNAKVIISGNRSACRGGGIGSNGDIIIGSIPPSGDVTISPVVSKKTIGRDMKEGETYTFSVYLETGNEQDTKIDGKWHRITTYTDQLLGTGTLTSGKDGAVQKIQLPGYTISNVGEANLGDKYTLLVVEDTISTDTLAADEQTYYALHYVIGQGKDSSGKACYKAWLYLTEKGSYTRNADGSIEPEYGSFTKPYNIFTFDQRIRSETSASASFTNYLLDRSVSVKKEWQQKDGKEMKTPEGASVTLELLADGKTAKDLNENPVPAVVLDGTADTAGETQAWTATWNKLPVFSDAEHTKRIEYAVRETACKPATFSAKTAKVLIPESGTAAFVNVFNPDTAIVDVKVRKEWADRGNLDGTRPESIQVTLLADDKELQVMTLNDENEWSATVAGLAKYNEKGQTIAYRWQEEEVPGYTAAADTTGYETVITNQHEPELTSVSVRKIWDDQDNALGFRPEQIIMKLSNGMTVVLNIRNNWIATISDLPVTYRGEPIEYTWTEQAVIGYTLTDQYNSGSMTVFVNSLWKRPDTPPEGKKPRLPGTPTVIPDYDTPLGVEVIINHVGDSFD